MKSCASCRVLSLSDCKYSLSPLSQTQIDWVGRNRIRWTFKLSCIWHLWYSLGVLLRIKYLLTNKTCKCYNKAGTVYIYIYIYTFMKYGIARPASAYDQPLPDRVRSGYPDRGSARCRRDVRRTRDVPGIAKPGVTPTPYTHNCRDSQTYIWHAIRSG